MQVNLAYRWLCGLSIEGKIPDHSAFSRARNERFRDSDLVQRVLERVVERAVEACLAVWSAAQASWSMRARLRPAPTSSVDPGLGVKQDA